ncbi:MAG: flagellar biosynthesis anti-sigma factor FlgM [bacterium]
MTIYSSGLHNVLRAYSGQKVTSNENKDNARVKTEAVGQDQVVLSPRARDLKQALAIVAKSSYVREEKIGKLTAAIKEGRYRVDSANVARSLLTKVREFSREV